MCPDSHSNSLVQASLHLNSDYYSDSDSDICVHFLDSFVNLCIPTVVLFSIKCQAHFTVL